MYFGRLEAAVKFVALVKGQGRVDYVEGQVDPNTGKAIRRNTGIDLALICTGREGDEYRVERNAIAEFGEWPTLILPSLTAIGATLRDLPGKWAQVELVPTGRRYTNKSGEEKESTTFSFVRIFGTEAEMNTVKAAYYAGDQDAVNAAPVNAPAAAQPPTSGDAGKATALQFARVFVKQAMSKTNGDVAAALALLGPMLAAQPVISKHLTAESPEVLEMLSEAAMPF